jgi:hypothetical protein
MSIRGEQRLRLRFQRIGHGQQSLIFDGSRQGRQSIGRSSRTRHEFIDILRNRLKRRFRRFS